jgi:hypothetical protein
VRANFRRVTASLAIGLLMLGAGCAFPPQRFQDAGGQEAGTDRGGALDLVAIDGTGDATGVPIDAAPDDAGPSDAPTDPPGDGAPVQGDAPVPPGPDVQVGADAVQVRDAGACPSIVVVGDNAGDDLQGAIQDTYITEDSPDEAHGVTDSDIINIDSGMGVRRHGLLRFDLHSLAGCKVTSAKLSVSVTDKSDLPYAAHEVLEKWDDQSATWNRASASTAWSVPGCTGTPCLDSAFGTLTFASMGVDTNALSVAVVQRWIDQPTSNLGILVRLQTGTDGIEFGASEAPQDGQRPRLTLTLTSR